MAHHTLDVHPIPDKMYLFINELDLTDPNAFETEKQKKKALEKPGDDVIRVYIPLDLSYDNIVRRLHEIERPDVYKARDWYCSDFRMRVDQIVKQMEIYDQIRTVRNLKAAIVTRTDDIGHTHSPEGIALAGEIVKYMEEYDEIFDEEIPELKLEYCLN